MPRGDRTGPEGEGPLTGRGRGYCSGSDVPGYMSPGPGMGRGAFGGGWYGRGGFGGWGRGYRHRFYATGLTRWARWAPPAWRPVEPAYDEGQEMADLKAQAGWLSEQLSAIQARLDKLVGPHEESPEA